MVMLWLFIVLVVIAVAAIIAVLIIDRRSSASSSTRTPKRLRSPWGRRGKRGVELPRRLANSASLFQLPAVRKRIRAQRWLHALLAVMLVSSLLSAAAIAGRPVRVSQRSDALANRDIVLCLDVSTSMVRIDSSVLTTFSEILDMADTAGPRSVEERRRSVRQAGRPLDTNPLGHVGELLAVWEQPSFDREPQAAAQEALTHAREVVTQW